MSASGLYGPPAIPSRKKAGVPGSADFVGALVGDLAMDTTTGTIYFNTGTTITPVWTPISPKSLSGNRGNTVAILGDSQAQGLDTFTPVQIGPRNFVAWACMLSNGRMQFTRNAGVSGQTTAQILARVQSDVIARTDAPKPAKCVIICGVNDIQGAGGSSIPLTGAGGTFDNITQMVNQLQAAGIEPILCTLPPWGKASDATSPLGTNGLTAVVMRQKIGILNAWIRQFAADARSANGRGLHVIELHDPLVSTAGTGNYNNANLNYTADGIHMSSLAAQTIGQNIANKLDLIFPNQWRPWLVSCTDDYPSAINVAGNGASIFPNGLFLTNAAGIATGWSQSGTGTPTCTAPSGAETTSGVMGNWQNFVWGAGSFPQLSIFTNTGFSVGDWIEVSGWVKTANVVSSGGVPMLRFTFNGAAAGSQYLTPVLSFDQDISLGLFSMIGQVPAGTTSFGMQMIVNTAACTLSLAQLTCVNRTTRTGIN